MARPPAIPAIPGVLETARCRLRPHEAADAAPIHAIWSEPRVAAANGHARTPELSWHRLLRETPSASVFADWVIEARDGGRRLGEIGFAAFGRDSDPPLDGDAEIGWVLSPECWGEGIATEAGTAALAWADATEHLRVVQLLLHFENHPALRLAARLGFTETGTTWFRDHQSVVLTRSRI